MTSLCIFSNEILLEILQYLSGPDAIPIGTTCKRLRVICLPLQYRVLTLDFSTSETFSPDRCCLYHSDELVQASFPKPPFTKRDFRKRSLPPRESTHTYRQQKIYDLKGIFSKEKKESIQPPSGNCALSGTGCLCLAADFRWWIRSKSTLKWIIAALHNDLPNEIMRYISTLTFYIPWGSNWVFLQLFVGHSANTLFESLTMLKEITISNVCLVPNSRYPVEKLMNLIGSLKDISLKVSFNSQGLYRYERIFHQMSGLKKLSVAWDREKVPSYQYSGNATEAAVAGVIRRSPQLESIQLVNNLLYTRLSIDRIISLLDGDKPLRILSLSLQNVDPPQMPYTIFRLRNLERLTIRHLIPPNFWQEQVALMWKAFAEAGLRLRSITTAIRLEDDLFDYLTSYPVSSHQLNKLVLCIFYKHAESLKDLATVFWRDVLPSISNQLTSLSILPASDGYSDHRARKSDPQTDEYMSKWSIASFNEEDYPSPLKLPHLKTIKSFALIRLTPKWLATAYNFVSCSPNMKRCKIDAYTDSLQSEAAFKNIMNEATDQIDMETINPYIKVSFDILMFFVRRRFDQDGNVLGSQDVDTIEDLLAKEETTGSITGHFYGYTAEVIQQRRRKQIK